MSETKLSSHEDLYVTALAARLHADQDAADARALLKTATTQMRDAAPAGEAAVTVERLLELDQLAVDRSGLSENDGAVQRLRSVQTAAQAIVAGEDPIKAFTRAVRSLV